MKRFFFPLLLCSFAIAQNTAKFPGAVPTPADLGVVSNRAETNLTLGITATATSIPVASSSGFKVGGFATIDNEIVAVCAIPDGTHLTVGISACPAVDGRGTDTANGGGAAASHLVNSKVQVRIVAWNRNQDAAEIIAVTRKLHDEFRSVKDYGAKGDGSTDDTAAIQRALDSFGFGGVANTPTGTSGGVLNCPAGVYRITAPLVWKRPNVTLRGVNMGGGPGTPGGCILYPTSGFTGSEVVRMDVADVNTEQSTNLAFLRGVALQDVDILMVDKPTVSPVINLRSVSNTPAWTNVTVRSHRGQSLYVGKSAWVGAQISEGITFSSFYSYATYGTGNNVVFDSAVVMENANEIKFNDSKIFPFVAQHGNTYAAVSIGDGCTSINFAATSLAGYVRGVSITSSTAYAPKYISFTQSIFEGLEAGIYARGSAAQFILYITADGTNRFTMGSIASPLSVDADYVVYSSFVVPQVYNPNGNPGTVLMGTNTHSNWIQASEAAIADTGSNVHTDSDYYNNRFIAKPGIASYGLQLWDTRASGSTFQELVAGASQSYFIRAHDNPDTTTYFQFNPIGLGINSIKKKTRLHINDWTTIGLYPNYAEFAFNAWNDLTAYPSAAWKYLNAGFASELVLPSDGSIHLRIAASGAQDAAITWKEPFVINPDMTITYTGPAALPTCNSGTRFKFAVVAGAGGVKDQVSICAKDAADTYLWRTIY